MIPAPARRVSIALGLLGLAAGLPAATEAADRIVLVERIADVTIAREAGELIVTATGIVPISGFARPALRRRPDLVKAEGGIVLDFIAAAPPPDGAVTQVETRLRATIRIAAAEAGPIRFVQVRAAAGSRTLQVIGGN